MSAPHMSPRLESIADRLQDEVLELITTVGILLLPDPALEAQLWACIERALAEAAESE